MDLYCLSGHHHDNLPKSCCAYQIDTVKFFAKHYEHSNAHEVPTCEYEAWARCRVPSCALDVHIAGTHILLEEMCVDCTERAFCVLHLFSQDAVADVYAHHFLACLT